MCYGTMEARGWAYMKIICKNVLTCLVFKMILINSEMCSSTQHIYQCSVNTSYFKLFIKISPTNFWLFSI